MKIANDDMTVWTWPLAMADLALKWTETVWGSAEVISVRLPIIAAAWREPSRGNRRELARMVTEKIDAFALSQRSLAPAHQAGSRAFAAWVRLVHGSLTGTPPVASALAQLAQTSLALAAAWTSAPGAALAPIHLGATRNARRLRQKR